MKISWVTVSVTIFVIIWFTIFLWVFLPSDSPVVKSETDHEREIRSLFTPIDVKDAKRDLQLNLRRQDNIAEVHPQDISDATQELTSETSVVSQIVEAEEAKVAVKEVKVEPFSLEEVRKNMTLYLHTLHSRLASMAGPMVTAYGVWDAYLDVTTNMPIKWDDQNKHRIPPQRTDKSIFVSLGTYRDPFCPMTLKSLYSQAAHPERLYVALLQQNCFEKKCRTGVLVGGRIEDTSTDIDCYKEFCKSPEGQESGACLDERVQLFNVNESESLGPYMARYLGAKFYR
jgi:Glycosyltransferase (GlcNAc)